MTANRRVFYAIYSVATAPLASSTFTPIHGLQSVGINTRFNLEFIFEIGQISLYAILEDIPDIEVTMQKVLDGNPLIYHLVTTGAISPTLVGRSNIRSTLGISIYTDTQNSASGTPVAQATCSGTFVQQIAYAFNTDGPSTEDVTCVGNNKTFSTVFTAPTFNNTDVPIGSGVIQRRQQFVYGLSLLPNDIPGVVSGVNQLQSDGSYAAHVQSIRTSVNLQRTPLYELGHKGAYFRYAQFPAQVQCDFDVLSSQGDNVQGLESIDNLTNQTIWFKTLDGTSVNLGVNNKMQSVTFGGANATQNGGNATSTYSYLNFNDFTIQHPQDPSGL